MATFKEMLVRLGGLRIVEPVVDVAWANVSKRRWQDGDGRSSGDHSPHGVRWNWSFHASSFPGDAAQACGRRALYQMIGSIVETPIDRWLESVSSVGTAIEHDNVRRLRDDDRLCRSNQPGRSTDPDFQGPQMGFVDAEHWLTASIDAPIIIFGHEDRPHIVEHKTILSNHIDEMAAQMRTVKEPHRRQLLCALGLAHEFGGQDFLHPTEDRVLAPPVDGSVYYVSRDDPWPGPVKTWEYYFSYDPEFMAKGRKHLAEWRLAFLHDEIPQTVVHKNTRSHPYGWRWSEGACKYCSSKIVCQMDYRSGVTKLSESRSVAMARMTRPSYDQEQSRHEVLDFWAHQGDEEARTCVS